MWIDLRKITPIHEAYLSSLGRALAVAQHYEATLKSLYGFTLIIDKIQSDQPIDEDEHKKKMAAWDTLSIDDIAQRIGQKLKCSDDEVQIIIMGLQAYKYITSQSTLIISEYPDRPDEVINKISIYQEKMKDLTNADNLVSSWDYEISEKEPAPKEFYRNHQPKLLNWIIEPVQNLNKLN